MSGQLGFAWAPVTAPTRCASLQPMRPYQEQAVIGIHGDLAKYDDALVISATGTGKTRIFTEVVHLWPEWASEFKTKSTRVLVLVDRDILAGQARARLANETGEPVGLEKAESRAGDERIVVASVQTLLRPQRLASFRPDAFGIIVYDECFPAGTLVDGHNPIEQVKVGDYVNAFDQESGLMYRRRVARTFRSVPVAMCRVRTARAEIACTPSHPFFTQRGWVKAAGLTCDDMVLYTTHANDVNDTVHGMRKADNTGALEAESLREDGARILLEGVHRGLGEQGQLGANGEDQSQIRLGPHDGEQSDVAPGGGRAPAHNSSRYGMEASGARGERLGADLRSIAAREQAWVGHGIPGLLRGRISTATSSDLLQAGHRLSDAENWHRGGRPEPQLAPSTRPGWEEAEVLGWTRVDRVEILQPSSDGTFGGVCPDGFVYNFEVEQFHTYTVGAGFVVHNCHHAIAPTRRKTVKYFRDGGAKLLGVTATPDRADEQPMGMLFRSVSEELRPAFAYEFPEAIADGWLVEFDYRPPRIDTIDFTRVRKGRGGELNELDVEAVIMAEKPLHGIADVTVRESGGMRVLGFAPGVASSKLLAHVCDRYAHDGWARWIAGQQAMDIGERNRIIAGHQKGDFPGLWQCSVVSEGYDDPSLPCLSFASPTASRAIHGQRMGRGARPVWPVGFSEADAQRATPEERRAAIARSAKPKCRIIEFTGNCGRHDLCSAADVLGGAYDPPIIERAKKILEEQGGSPGEALKEALAAAEAARLAELASRARVTADVSYTVSPLEAMHMKAKDDAWARRFRGDPATKAQKDCLVYKWRIPEADVQKLSKAEAARLMTTCLYRAKYNKANYSQVAKMRAVGIDGFKLSYQQACQMCGAIQDARGKRPPEETIAAIMGQRSET